MPRCNGFSISPTSPVFFFFFSLIITISRVGAATGDKFQLKEVCKQRQPSCFLALHLIPQFRGKFMHFSNENENFPMP